MTVKCLSDIINAQEVSAFAPAASGTRRIQIDFTASGLLAQFVFLGGYVATETFTLPGGLLGSHARCRVVGTGVTNLYVAVNGTPFMQVQFTSGANSGAMLLAVDTIINAGDHLTLYSNEIGSGLQDVDVGLLSSPVGQGGGSVTFESIDLVGAVPAAPPANTVRMFRRSVAGRQFPAFVGPSGLDMIMQEALHGNNVFMIGVTPGSSLPSVFGGTLTGSGTGSSPGLSSASGLWPSMYRKRFTTASTVNSVAGIRTAYPQWHRGQVARQGGFFYRCRFGQGFVPATGPHAFIGLCASTAALAGNPSALIDMIGMGYDATDAAGGNWCLMMNDGAGIATKIDLGSNAARSGAEAFDLSIFCRPHNGATPGDITVEITNIQTGVMVLPATTYTTDLPRNTSFMHEDGSEKWVIGSCLQPRYLGPLHQQRLLSWGATRAAPPTFSRTGSMSASR